MGFNPTGTWYMVAEDESLTTSEPHSLFGKIKKTDYQDELFPGLKIM